MNITVCLLNNLGDEVGNLNLDAVRVAAAGTETVPPDLAGQMAQLTRRLDGALAERDLAPVLDPLGVRIAVSHALLTASPDGVSIPLQIRYLDGGDQVIRSTASASPGTATDSGGWDDLFVLGPEKEEGLSGHGLASPGRTVARGAGSESGNPRQSDQPDYPEALDQWTELGDLWDMGNDGEGEWK